MKIEKRTTLIIAFITALGLASCKKNSDDALGDSPAKFDVTTQFIAGTITPKNGSYKSVYLINY